MEPDPATGRAAYIEAAVKGILVASIYLPNCSRSRPKFTYKLAWFDRLIKHATSLKRGKQPVILAGDYNVVPTDLTYLSHQVLGRRCAAAAEPRRVPAPVEAGLDRFARAMHPGEKIYTFWDYKRNRWPRDAGLRLITSCSAPALRRACATPASTGRCEAGKAPATSRPGRSWTKRSSKQRRDRRRLRNGAVVRPRAVTTSDARVLAMANSFGRHVDDRGTARAVAPATMRQPTALRAGCAE
jgi:hypothetical protein